MINVTASDPIQTFLRSIREEAVIHDAEGKVLGCFIPGEEAQASLYAHARALFDPVEIKRRKTAEHGQGKTTREVLNRLRSLENPGCGTR